MVALADENAALEEELETARRALVRLKAAGDELAERLAEAEGEAEHWQREACMWRAELAAAVEAAAEHQEEEEEQGSAEAMCVRTCAGFGWWEGEHAGTD